MTEGKHQLHFGLVQVVAELSQSPFQIVAGDRAKVEVGHRLLGEALQDVDPDILADILDAKCGVFGHSVHRSCYCLTGRTQRSTVLAPTPKFYMHRGPDPVPKGS